MILGPTALALVLTLTPPGADGEHAAEHTIPAFARRYRTSCSTCHTAAPKLNVMGEAFRLNGYRFPVNEQLLRKEEPVPLGEEPWKELWPRTIWPGELPASPPLALRLQTDMTARQDATERLTIDFRFPHEVYLFAGASLGEHVATFLEVEWSREAGVGVEQAKVKLQNVLPGLRERLLNLWIGLQRLYLFTFADPEIDRAGRQSFEWQSFRVADLPRSTSTGPAPSLNGFSLAASQPAIELNGLATRRLFYALGVGQGAGSATADNNRHKDIYYKLRYKLGGLALDGTYDAGKGPVLGGHGQLLDRSVTLEHFGYFGKEPATPNSEDTHRALGVALRLLHGPLDVGAGYVWAHSASPWGAGAGALDWQAVFAKGEYLVFPWLIGSVKFEHFDLEPPPPAAGTTQRPTDLTRLLPGLIALVRHNVRFVVEGDVFLLHELTAASGAPKPSALVLRLDVNF